MTDADDSGPARLGSLERAFLEILWKHDDAISARQVQAEYADRKLAYATVRTVLERLARKDFLTRTQDGRTLLYRAAQSREGFIAELMRQALQLTEDRDAALAYFARSATDEEAAALRSGLNE